MPEQSASSNHFQKVSDAAFVRGEHDVLEFWTERRVFERLIEKNADGPLWSFLDGPITANNPMGVHHAWGRAYKDVYQRYRAMTGHRLRYQNGFDCQGLWVEVEVERDLGLSTKSDVHEFGIDRFVTECKRRVLRFAARQTEQSVRLGYWMDWDAPDTLARLAETIGTDQEVTIETPRGETVSGPAHQLVAGLGNPDWGGSYFTFSTENNETIWAFLKKCFTREKLYRGHDVMPWSGRGGSAYSQMEVADGRRLSVHESVFARFPLTDVENEYLLIWTTTPWTLAANVACAVNPELDYVRLRAERDGAIYYLAADNLESARLDREFREGFGRPEWSWPEEVPTSRPDVERWTFSWDETTGWSPWPPWPRTDDSRRNSVSWPARKRPILTSDRPFLIDSANSNCWWPPNPIRTSTRTAGEPATNWCSDSLTSGSSTWTGGRRSRRSLARSAGCPRPSTVRAVSWSG